MKEIMSIGFVLSLILNGFLASRFLFSFKIDKILRRIKRMIEGKEQSHQFLKGALWVCTQLIWRGQSVQRI